MISQQQLYDQLTIIARNHNLSGDAVELQKDWLSFIFANYSTEVTNAFMESNIATSTLMNDKITQCMSVMYPVYRGRNAKVFFNGYYDRESQSFAYNSNTVLKCDKYDLIYTSNNFYVYANSALNISQTLNSSSNPSFEGLITTRPKYKATIEVTESNKYYIDVKIDDRLLSNLSEDLMIKLNEVETSTTRMFYEHINQLRRDNIVDYSQLYNENDFSEVDQETKLFILTIPDYGIRIFKKGYFKVADVLEIQCFQYTTKDELVKNYEKELTKIKLDGFDMKVDVNSKINDEGDIYNNYIINDIPRDNINSLLYNATAYSHVQSQIMSNSDIDTLFTEYFREYTIQSSHVATLIEGGEEDRWRIYIYYIPIQENNLITEAAINTFKATYASYYISNDIVVLPVSKLQVTIDTLISISESVELLTNFQSIFAEYENELPIIDEVNEDGTIKHIESSVGSHSAMHEPEQVNTEITYYSAVDMNIDRVKADITKLPSVNYLKTFNLYIGDELVTDLHRLTHDDNWYPVYLKFIYNISYVLE